MAKTRGTAPKQFNVADKINDPWCLKKTQKQMLHSHWRELAIADKREELKCHMKEFNILNEKLESFDVASQVNGARGVRIIGMTTSGASSHCALLSGLRPAIVICEEAGEVLESHIIASIGEYTQHIVMIGDYQQLRPKVGNYQLSVDSGQGYNLDESMFERLVNVCQDKYKTKEKMMNNGSLTVLHTQRRMRPEVADLIRMTLYPLLEDDDKVKNYPDVKGMGRNLWFFDHNHPEEISDSSVSHSNKFEAGMVLQLALRLIRQGYSADQIAILTPYSGQLLRLREMFMKKSLAVHLDERTKIEMEEVLQEKISNGKKLKNAVSKNVKDCVRMSTVDNFQGEEADVVIISR